MVYWTEEKGEGGAVRGQLFPSEQMSAALGFMEALRARQRAGEAVCFITMCSENPNAVGPAGVADPAPDYDWKKRRR